MAKIVIKQKGDFQTLENLLSRSLDNIEKGNLDKYGRLGVQALEVTTPKDTGLTSQSWSYEVNKQADGKVITLSFHNSNVNKGVPIAIVLQYGHGTRNGGWVEGVDYINPALRPIFEKIAKEVWEEVRK